MGGKPHPVNALQPFQPARRPEKHLYALQAWHFRQQAG
jgi:hypothetical protein